MKTTCSNSAELDRLKRAAEISSEGRAFAILISFSLLLAPATHAGVQHLYLNGSVATHKVVAKNDLQVKCDSDCKERENLSELSGQTSITVNCPECTLKGDPNGEFANQTVASAKASVTASQSRSFSTTTQTATFTASGTADLFVSPIENAAGRFFLKADLSADGNLSFEVFDHAETITINKSISGSGLGNAIIVLTQVGGEVGGLGKYSIDFETGVSLDTTLPSSLSLQPGRYELGLSVVAQAVTNLQPRLPQSALKAGFQVTLSVTVPSSTVHWKNPEGGDFGTASNWDPQRIPESDTFAIFDLPANNSGPVPIVAADKLVGQMAIGHRPVRLTGKLRQIGTSPDFIDFSVQSGGSLALESGATFWTEGAAIGRGADESSVIVSGDNTTWTSSSFRNVVIGAQGPGKLIVENDGIFTTLTNIIVGQEGLGALRVESGGFATAEKCTVTKGSSLEVRGTGPGQRRSFLELLAGLELGGASEKGTVVIENGGHLFVDQAVRLNGPSSITISGVGVGDQLFQSELKTTTDFEVKGDGAAQVEVKDRALLNVSRNISIGYFGTSQQGKLLVHGESGQTHTTCNANDLAVYNGQLEVSDGALVNAHDMSIGIGAQGDIADVTVSDSDSRLSILLGRLWVGGSGKGTLTVSGGALAESGTGRVGQSLNGLGTGSGFVSIIHGALSSTEWHVSGDCEVGTDEPGTILLNGGTALGGLIGPDAKLTVGNTLIVGPRGTIDGNGTLSAGQIINNGFIRPGLSPGVLKINGKYQQTPTGAIRIEVAGLDAGKFDVLEINGDATLAGRVELGFIQGFVPSPGDSVEFLKISGKATGTLDVVPLIIPHDSSAARPAMLAQAKLIMSADGKGTLMVTDVRPTVELNIAFSPLAAPDRKVDLNFTPVAGSNHFVEFRDGLAAGSTWQPFPGAPHNSGLLSDRATNAGRFYRVRVAN